MKLLIAFICFLFSISALAQIDTLFYENFDQSNWSMSTSRAPLNTFFQRFHADQLIRKGFSGASATDTVGPGCTSYLTSPKFSLKDSLGFLYPNIGLLFDQLCYVHQLDQAMIEYRLGDSSWKTIPMIVNVNGNLIGVYQGNSAYFGPSSSLLGPINSTDHYFNKYGQVVLWRFNDTNYVYTIANSQNAWVLEYFDISGLIQWELVINNFPQASLDSMQIRFSLHDHSTGPMGRIGTHQWWIDNVRVLATSSVGLNELSTKEFRISPNPVQDQLSINGDVPPSANYRIYSINGQLQKEGNLKNRELVVSDLNAGVYLLEMLINNSRTSLKFIKK